MRTPAFIMILALLSQAVKAQLTFVNNGASIMVNSLKVIIDGDAFLFNTGQIVNSGDISLTGNWTNNSSNNVFTAGPDGWLRLTGENQTIDGTTLTYFNNLELTGTGVKSLLGVNAEIEDMLALNDREFYVDSNTLTVLNTNVNAITRADVLTGGFVSSIDEGGLERYMNSSSDYIFPVGSGTGITCYRPVEIEPSLITTNSFKVRMANVNPDTESYTITSKENDLCTVNENFFHKISQTSGNTSANITIYYDSVTDGIYKTIAHWQNLPQWEKIPSYNATGGSQFQSIRTSGAWNNFIPTPFILANLAPDATISTDPVCESENVFISAPSGYLNYEFYINGSLVQNSASNSLYSYLNPGDSIMVIIYDDTTCTASSGNFLSPVYPKPDVIIQSDKDTISIGESLTLTSSGADSFYWINSGETSSNITVSPNKETEYLVIGTNEQGCSDTASFKIYVDANCIYWLPNIFSPNGDGNNDLLNIMGTGFLLSNFSIYDRWGNKVFETYDLSTGWDGTYKGQIMDNAVFVYIIQGQCTESLKEFNQQGNITLVK